MKKVGIIGCGAIGSGIAAFIAREFSALARVSYVCDHSAEKAGNLKKQVKGAAVCSMAELLLCSDVVVEAASPAAVKEILKKKRRRGQEILIMSVGGLLGVKKIPAGIFVPSGAIAGLDGIAAAREAGILSVRIVTRKPPRGLDQAPYFKKKKFPKLYGGEAIRVFKGNAREAVENFPANINVAAVLSLAGTGPEKTEVEIWTSMAYTRNVHEVTVESKAGSMTFITRNIPSPENPRTSALAIESGKACLRRIFGGMRVGT